MSHFLELAIAIQRSPRDQWEDRLAALPDSARAPVLAWLAANPTSSGGACDWVPMGRKNGGVVGLKK